MGNAHSTTDRAFDALAVHFREQMFHPGEFLGTERQLAQQLGIGRTVLRAAVDRFEAQGTVRRVIGRNGGLFFHDGRIQRSINTIEGVPDMVRRQGMTIKTRVLQVELGIPYPDEARVLKLPPAATVVRILRLRLVDDIPWSLDLSVLPSERFPGVMSRDLTGSLYRLLADSYSLDIDVSTEAVVAGPATVHQAGLLEIEPGAGLLLVRRTTWERGGGPVEYASDAFRADRTRIHTQNSGNNWKRSVRRDREGKMLRNSS